MIYGIGTDIVEVSRIKKSLEKGNGFKELVYSPKEVLYCERINGNFESFAGRFAAKEAFLKALGTGWSGELSFNEIEITNDEKGKPVIALLGKTREELASLSTSKIHLSISHSAQQAVAFVIIEIE